MRPLLDLFQQAMANTGTTMRLCLLMLVAAVAYLISRLR
jgi:hypothetical protein